MELLLFIGIVGIMFSLMVLGFGIDEVINKLNELLKDKE